MAEALLAQSLFENEESTNEVIVITISPGETYTLLSAHSQIGILQITSTGGNGITVFRSNTSILTYSKDIEFDVVTASSGYRWCAGKLSLSIDNKTITLTSTYALSDPIITSMILL